MKTSTRLVLGLISSLLLSAGFAKAASHLDPLSNSPLTAIASADDPAHNTPAWGCEAPCSFAEPL